MSILQMQWKHKAYHDRNAIQNHYCLFSNFVIPPLHKEPFSVQRLNKSRSLVPELSCVNDPLVLWDVDKFLIFLTVYSS